MANGNPGVSVQQNITVDTKGEKNVGGQLFNVRVTFNNHTTEPYIIPSQHIIELVMEEDLNDWPIKGYMIYSNKNEAIERNESENAWFYRMDARDELRVEISIPSDDPTTDIEFPPEVWAMDLNFVIYDMEDIPAANITEKAKKIYFWSKEYQVMLDKKVTWSTVIAQKIKNASHLTDNERGMLTGDAIKSLLEDTTGAGYPNSTDPENWDIGINNMFYSSPVNNNIYDTLDDLLNLHTSTQNTDRVIFKFKNRIEPIWQLIPLYKFFDNAGNDPNVPGPWQLERYWFEDIGSEEGNTSPYRSPYKDGLDFKVDIKMLEYSKIYKYDFIDMSGIDNSRALISRPVYTYFFDNGQFGVDYVNNEIENVRSEFKRMYTDKLLPAGKAEPIFTLNDTKKDQKNVDPQFIWTRSDGTSGQEYRSLKGRCKILFGGIFLNELLRFRVLGSPHRTIGKFAAIERKTSDEKFNFDNKICGQWFVVKVKHIWNQNRYVNDVYCVKTHMHRSNRVNEGIT